MAGKKNAANELISLQVQSLFIIATAVPFCIGGLLVTSCSAMTEHRKTYIVVFLKINFSEIKKSICIFFKWSPLTNYFFNLLKMVEETNSPHFICQGFKVSIFQYQKMYPLQNTFIEIIVYMKFFQKLACMKLCKDNDVEINLKTCMHETMQRQRLRNKS